MSLCNDSSLIQRRRYARESYLKGNLDKALSIYFNILEEHPEDMETIYELARLYYGGKQERSFIMRSRKAVKRLLKKKRKVI